jgi:hypothetical protein
VLPSDAAKRSEVVESERHDATNRSAEGRRGSCAPWAITVEGTLQVTAPCAGARAPHVSGDGVTGQDAQLTASCGRLKMDCGRANSGLSAERMMSDGRDLWYRAGSAYRGLFRLMLLVQLSTATSADPTCCTVEAMHVRDPPHDQRG